MFITYPKFKFNLKTAQIELCCKVIACNTHHFDVPASDHDSVHLLKCQLSGLWNVVLDEGETLVFLSYRIPRHVYRLYGTERKECLPYCVFFQLKTYTADVNSAEKTRKNFKNEIENNISII